MIGLHAHLFQPRPKPSHSFQEMERLSLRQPLPLGRGSDRISCCLAIYRPRKRTERRNLATVFSLYLLLPGHRGRASLRCELCGNNAGSDCRRISFLGADFSNASFRMGREFTECGRLTLALQPRRLLDNEPGRVGSCITLYQDPLVVDPPRKNRVWKPSPVSLCSPVVPISMVKSQETGG
jgi:hypothetical protein